jgi:ribosomal-protein-alanine N-acetyltransferase
MARRPRNTLADIGPRIDTERLILRRWRHDDLEPFARMNADPRVMEYFPRTLTSAESDALADFVEDHFARRGFGPFAAEIRETGAFAGFIGLSVPSFEAHFTPAIEIGWRLAYECWGQGYATEGARAVLRLAFGELSLPGIVSFTVPANMRSRRVMEKLGMTRDPADDFDHPKVMPGHPLRRHVLYRLHAPSLRS